MQANHMPLGLQALHPIPVRGSLFNTLPLNAV